MRSLLSRKALGGFSHVGSLFGDRGADKASCPLIAQGSQPNFLGWDFSGDANRKASPVTR